jgi:hypothetical protein
VSSILKALQRVEQERPAGAPSAPRRALRGDFVAQTGKPLLRRPRRRGPNLRVWGSLGAVVLLALLVWWRLPERSQPEVVAAAPEASRGAPEARAEPQHPVVRDERVARAEPAVVPPPEAGPAPPPAAEAPPPVVARSAEPAAAPVPQPEPQAAVPVEVAERLPPLGTTLDAPVPARAPEPAPVPAPAAPVQQAPAPAPQPPAVAAPEAKPAPEPVRAAPAPPVQPVARTERPAPPARPARVAAKPAPPPAPSAPAVLVERTSWHPSAERRVAWVSVEGITGPRELHEGDAVGALVVKEIRPSSVVFLHGADTLQRRVGERQ